MRVAERLVRKQFLISPDQIKKLELLAKKEKSSAAEMVRKAIDAYSPKLSNGMDESELLELVASRVKEAIADTKKTRSALTRTLKNLGT
jgi:DNA-binding protein Fis